jgi:N-formylglutamate amidohydrolase
LAQCRADAISLLGKELPSVSQSLPFIAGDPVSESSVLHIAEAEGALAIAVFSSPHSGANYPAAFLEQTRLDPVALRRSEDAFVDELFAAAPAAGAPLIRALLPRALLDLNREPYELDPRMFDGRVPSFANTRSLRVAGGLGTVPRVVAEAQEIYDRRLPISEAITRIETIYKPYHRALRRLLLRTQRQHGAAILVDCHSMPSRGTAREDRPRADVVLGDRYGASCAPHLTDAVEAILRELGYVVARNRPYAGGYITEHYGSPLSGLHALQIEVNRALYMDEGAYTKLPDFTRVAADLGAVVRTVVNIQPDGLTAFPAAAE